MESLTLQNFISLITVFVSWLLVVFLLTAKTKNKISNILLSLFLLVNAQDASGLFASYFLYPKFPGLGMLFNSSVFLKMPLLYLYVLSVIYSDFKFQKKHLWHILPWLLNFIVLIPRYFAVDFDDKLTFLNENIIVKKPEIIISYFVVHIQMVIYFIWSFIAIKKYKTLLLENYSNASLFNYTWLFQLISIFAFEAFFATFKNILLFAHSETIYFYTMIILQITLLILLCWIVLKALHNPELFRGINSNMQLVKQLVIESPVSHNSLNTEKELDEIVLLKNHMKEAEPYLNAMLTIDDLANQIEIPTKDLSVLINHNLNKHFFDFVNEYRIEKAKELLVSEDRKGHTVLEILYEVGFNSKSSFNTAFKKYTQVTPTLYRKNAIKKAS